jgi:hypothetical protein
MAEHSGWMYAGVASAGYAKSVLRGSFPAFWTFVLNDQFIALLEIEDKLLAGHNHKLF